MVKSFWSRVGGLWCRIMHHAPMWPSCGYYRCSVCLRTYPVLWEHDEAWPAESRSVTPALNRPVPMATFAAAPLAFARHRGRNLAETTK